MKPILIIWIPARPTFLNKPLRESLKMFQEYAELKSAGNHCVLTLPSVKLKDIKVECFNAENVDPIDLQKFIDAIDEYKKSLQP